MGRPKKLWAKRSYQTANYVVTFGFLMGALPVKWNKKNNAMVPVTSRFDKLRWMLTIAWVVGWSSVIYVDIFIKIAAAADKTEFMMNDPFRIGFALLGLGVSCFHIHTAWKYKEFAGFINRAARYYEYFQNRYATKEEWRGYTIEDTISGRMKVFFFFTLLMCTVFVIAYLFQCKKHFLFYVLSQQLCGSGYSTIYANVLITMLGSLTQFHFAGMMASGTILYVDLFAAVVLVGLYIVCELSDFPLMKRRTTKKLLQPSDWHHCFRCLDLTVKELNDCIGDVFMPAHMIFIIIATSGPVMLLIRYDVGPMINAILFGMLFCIGIYYKFLIGRGALFCQASATAIHMSRLKMKTKYFALMHKACKELRPNVGGFFPLKKNTISTMLQTSSELTADVLLM